MYFPDLSPGLGRGGGGLEGRDGADILIHLKWHQQNLENHKNSFRKWKHTWLNFWLADRCFCEVKNSNISRYNRDDNYQKAEISIK